MKRSPEGLLDPVHRQIRLKARKGDGGECPTLSVAPYECRLTHKISSPPYVVTLAQAKLGQRYWVARTQVQRRFRESNRLAHSTL
ncbi:hypothetical protein [Neolewinella antarctica]|uniref:Uncharacterized protein n=1 Tax=Neolewinella antarctica TaxID=442734 RepID=A0ABX0XAX8_9BACT|nr:hypothetical protein [Neolewinella antarctica]NJC25983.1 hypothetical protein [Neolewinella antarctica]